jgi:hypothetical protein
MVRLVVTAFAIGLPTAQVGFAQQTHLLHIQYSVVQDELSLTESQKDRTADITRRYQLAREQVEKNVLGRSLSSINKIENREDRNAANREAERILRTDVSVIKQIDSGYRDVAETHYAELVCVLSDDQLAQLNRDVVKSLDKINYLGALLLRNNVSRKWLGVTDEQFRQIDDAWWASFPREKGDGTPYRRFEEKVRSILTQDQRQKLAALRAVP